jgi:hypothetical protein
MFKTTHLSVVALAVGIFLTAGCQKKEESPAPPVQEKNLQKQVDATANAVADAAKTAAAQAQKSVKEQTDAVKTTGQKAADEGTSKAQALIDTAKKLVDEGKLDQVASTLTQLKGLKLTPEQETSLTQLKEKLEKMIQDAAKGAAGGLLPK